METDIERAVHPAPLEREVLNELIAQHLYRTGMHAVARLFCQESGTHVSDAIVAPFLEMNSVVRAIHEQNYEPALQYIFAVFFCPARNLAFVSDLRRWVEQHQMALTQVNSKLEFLCISCNLYDICAKETTNARCSMHVRN